MRMILLFLVFPLMINAQVNRSASQLAQENIQDYLRSKLFKDQPYHPESFGELKPLKEDHSETSWIMEHKFQVAEKVNKGSLKPVSLDNHEYWFFFFLDKKMRVVKAESIQQ
ncbi:hypothetical protein [Flavisolibacter ginsengisoli]|uniref:Uncharacterized protein n=1 Tax=Flavisolibacter ginsengisoli DSM 18119 TaxID=1121884 RepID=A0A1M5C091_9BACT|nr:hypothetical protein [Flavisolibacter ginsengisoli]SHF48086.1 hypothetical protein SAMN02745131_02757 [Flavisolibacter ginsengisoli DSM 18119]